MPVDIPIDEVKAITLKVSPTYNLDRVESVTLKSFRKVVGYDTFNSILKEDRDEKKDPSDHYNVTVSMMIQRVLKPVEWKTKNKPQPKPREASSEEREQKQSMQEFIKK